MHRGGPVTAENYRGVPVHAAPGVHERVVELLGAVVPKGSRVADLGAGQGALSLRLRDAGYSVSAFDLDGSGWQGEDIVCHTINLEESLEPVATAGPFRAFCLLEVIEHLENPRAFLRGLVELAKREQAVIILSTPNPLDTFSCITMFSRGVFNWFSRDHYLGGGHVSILPYWMISEHLRLIGIAREDWHFVAPYVHPNPAKQAIYRLIGAIRRRAAKADEVRFFEGQTALAVIHP